MNRDPQTEQLLAQAKTLAKKDDIQAAHLILERICSAHPDDEEVNFLLGVANLRLSDTEKAEACFQKVLQINSSSSPALFYLGLLYAEQGQLEKSEQSFLESLRLEQGERQRSSIYFRLGLICQKQDRKDHAISYYKKCIAIQANNAVAHYNLGMMYYGMDRLEHSEAELEQAIRINPKYVNALASLAKLKLDQGDLEQAEKYCTVALSADPGSADVLLSLGYIFIQQNKYQDAVELYRKVVGKDPESFTGWKRLAGAYKLSGNAAESVRCYRKALRLHPDSEEVTYQLAVAGEVKSGVLEQVPDEVVTRLFDGYAKEFDSHLVTALQYRIPEKLYQKLSPLLGEPVKQLHVMDLGCGTGLCGRLFSEYAKTLYGVDLSPNMVEKAMELGCYDELTVGDVLMPLEHASGIYDLVLAADVFVYIGKLDKIFKACSESLCNGGLFAFSIEGLPGDSKYFSLRNSGRYAHTKEYLRGLADRVGFEEICITETTVRTENSAPVEGFVVVFRKSG